MPVFVQMDKAFGPVNNSLLIAVGDFCVKMASVKGQRTLLMVTPEQVSVKGSREIALGMA